MADEGNSGALPPVVLCCGKDCQREDSFEALRSSLKAHCAVRETPCLGHCKGPLVVLHLDSDQPTVLSRVRRPKHVRDLLETLRTGSALSERLAAREVTGGKCRKALRRALRAAKRAQGD